MTQSNPHQPSTEKQLVLCFDMDGTILDEHERFYPQDIPVLRAPPPEVQFILATGRSLPSVLLTYVKNGLLETGQPLPYPAVCQNGAVNYLPGGLPHDHVTFKPDLVAEIIQRLEPYPQLTILLFLIENILSYRMTPYGKKMLDLYDLSTRDFDGGLNHLLVTKVMCISQDPAPLARLFQDAADLPVERTYSFNTILEFGPLGVHKAAGIDTLLRAMGLSRLPRYAAGDGMNDITMLRSADRTFAPDTASEYARSLAQVIVPVREQGLLAPMLADWSSRRL